jgi:methylenetetrahydrofolate reductase (NADPH)
VPTVSFEFFPPHTDKGSDNLIVTAKALEKAKPEYFSVTFGAGGSTQTRTPDTVLNLKKHLTTPVAPHLSCIGTNKKLLKSILDKYNSNEISQLVALRGDLPSGTVSRGDFCFATDLVKWIRENYNNTFNLHVACYPECHPQSRSSNDDFKHFCEKVKAGADTAITQYFFNADAYFYFVEKCHKHDINIPIVPGIMPITNYYKLAHFSEMCGAEIPRWARKQMEYYADDEKSLKDFGVEFVSHLCDNLIQGGVENFHFYTLNQAEPTLSICKNLKIY